MSAEDVEIEAVSEAMRYAACRGPPTFEGDIKLEIMREREREGESEGVRGRESVWDHHLPCAERGAREIGVRPGVRVRERERE